MFTLKIETDNAAFEERPADEVARILQEVADLLYESGVTEMDGRLRDINGNRVGSWELS